MTGTIYRHFFIFGMKNLLKSLDAKFLQFLTYNTLKVFNDWDFPLETKFGRFVTLRASPVFLHYKNFKTEQSSKKVVAGNITSIGIHCTFDILPVITEFFRKNFELSFSVINRHKFNVCCSLILPEGIVSHYFAFFVCIFSILIFDTF